jgi:hypothetical protein
MASEKPLLGAVKKIRAIRDLVYLGRSVRGRRKVRVDHKLGAYDETMTPGEEFECEQAFAKEAVMAGKAELVSGGQVEVVHQEDGFPIYLSWVRDPAAPPPVFERVELFRPLFFPPDCVLPKGFKCRLDLSPYKQSMLCYEDTEMNPELHGFRVLKLSPKKLKMTASEQAGKVNAIFDKLFPATV